MEPADAAPGAAGGPDQGPQAAPGPKIRGVTFERSEGELLVNQAAQGQGSPWGCRTLSHV